MHHTIRVRAIIAIVAASAVAALAGCSVVSTAGGDATSSSSAGTSSPGVVYATKQIQAAMESPKFVAPGPAFDASKASGKSVWFIPNSSSIPFTLAVQKAFQDVATKVGIKLTVWPSTGKPTEWVQGIDQAIAQKADLVVMAAPPQLVGPQLAELKAAGIPVVVPHQYDPTMDKPDNITAFQYAPFLDAANLMADQAIVDTKGKADTLVITTNESPPSKPMADSIRAEYKKHCPDCSITEVNVPVADWGSKMQSEVQTALLRDPKMNYIITIFDSATQFVVPGVAAAGKTGQVGIATFNNTPFVLTNVQKGVVNMDVGESITWIGYSSMDQVLRILSGVKPAKDESAALRVFTKENADVLGDPADNEKGYDSSYIDAYEKLWGIN
ncbi:MAG TPA: sugar ABC transporter substrate-binding protein [Pseudolysinimonas sp.]|jgi:ribose transport system substrate-binding protein